MQRTMITTTILLLAALSVTVCQQAPIGAPVPPLGTGPFVFDTAEQHKLRAVVVAKGLSHPWSMAFLPDGGILVSERSGNLRIVRESRDGVLNAQPVSGVPKVSNARLAGLMDIALHPQFATNRLVYLTYSKPEPKMFRTALARGRLEGNSLTDVRELFQSEVHFDNAASASRVVFGRDGMVYMSIGGATVASQSDKHGQDPASTAERLFASATTAPCLPIILLPESPATSRRFTRSDIATSLDCLCIPKPAKSGRTRMARTAATN